MKENVKSLISKKFGINNNSLHTFNFNKLIQNTHNLLKIRSLNKMPSKELNIILQLFAAHECTRTHTHTGTFSGGMNQTTILVSFHRKQKICLKAKNNFISSFYSQEYARFNI